MKPIVCCFLKDSNWNNSGFLFFRLQGERIYASRRRWSLFLRKCYQIAPRMNAQQKDVYMWIGHPLYFKGFMIWLVLSSCFFPYSTWFIHMPTCDPLLLIESTCINKLWSPLSLLPSLVFSIYLTISYIHVLVHQSTRSRIDIRPRENRRKTEKTGSSSDWRWAATC